MRAFKIIVIAWMLMTWTIANAEERKMEDTTLYAVIEVQITDRKVFMDYVNGHLPSVTQYGGKFLNEFQMQQTFEDQSIQGISDWNLLVIQEWASEEAFLSWWNSSEYAQWKELRPQGANVKLTLSTKLKH